ncbi:MAG: MATE family efflux transporter [Firmicutes bacterium HGW-Firmicutes-5]|nr:MAG: MATE family efflux transporter [Firmicutes bacterium HGW-Firmicutes-5]
MSETDLTKGSILEHMKRIAIPSSIGLLFNTLYNVVDTYYAGMLSTDALAGLTLSFPIFFIIIALSSGIGSGTTALSSIALGENSLDDFHKLAYNALLSGILISLFLGVIGFILTPFLFTVTGASGPSMALGISYTQTIFFGAGFFILSFILNGILNAQGDTKSYRNFLIFGFFMNLILDPLFIFGWFGIPKMGVIGIAFATVVVQLIGTVYLTYRVIKSPLFNYKAFMSEHLSSTTIISLFKQGMPASLNMATIAIGVFVINYFILYFDNATTIAAFGAAVRVEQLALLPALGLNVATLTIAGQNFGAKKITRIYEVLSKSIWIGVAIMVTGAVIIFIFAPYAISIFNDDPLVISSGTTYLRIEALALPTYVILNAIISVLQGIKKPNFAVYIGLYRQILMPFILFHLLGTYFGLGIYGVWWGIVIINWTAVAIAFFFFRRIASKAIPLA